MNFVHRDLKPHNVLLTNDDPPNAKVADFGMAKVFDSLSDLRVRGLTFRIGMSGDLVADHVRNAAVCCAGG